MADFAKTVERFLAGTNHTLTKLATETPRDLFPGEETYLEPVNPDLPAMPGKQPSLAELLQQIADNTRDAAPQQRAKSKLRMVAYLVSATVVTTIPGNPGRLSLSLYNNGPDTVYLIPFGSIDTGQGMPLPVDAEREVKAADSLYLLSDGTSDVRTLEELS